MKNFVRILIGVTFVIFMSSCQRTFTSCNRSIQTGDRNYEITQYSGGKIVATYKFRGMLNSSEQSDGYYFYQGDTLIELSGDLKIKSWK